MSFYFPASNKIIWRNSLFSFLLLLSWIFFLFWDTFSGMVSIWARSETFTHGFLVPPIVIWLIWRKRKLIFSRVPKPSYFSLVAIFLVSIGWLLGDLVSVNFVTQLAATAIIVLLVFAVFGWAVTSIIIFPLFFLFFAVPLGEFLLPVLMEWTAKFTVIAIRLSGVPVYQEGLQFIISSGSWSVVEACSGVRYLISSVMIGTLYAYLNYQSINRRLIFVCVSIAVPVFANWLRAYFIVMLGHFSENKLAVGFDHLIYGWVFFGIVVMLMFFIGGRWAENSIIDEDNPIRSMDLGIYRPYFLWTLVFLVFFAVAIPVGWSKLIIDKKNLISPDMSAPDTFSATWNRAEGQLTVLKPSFQGAVIDVSAVYQKNSTIVGFFIAYYRNQDYGSKLVGSENSIVTSKNKEWAKIGGGSYVLGSLTNPLTVRVTNLRNVGIQDRGGDNHLQVWNFYWVNGVFTDSDYKAKIYGAVQRLLGKGDDSAHIVLYAKDDGNDIAKKSMEEFLKDNYFEIKNMLEKTRVQ